jgi:hypothetical protein
MSHDLVGIILEKSGSRAKVQLRNRLDAGDPVEFLSPGIEERLFATEAMADEEGQALVSARNEDIIFMNVPDEARVHDLIRRQKDFRSAKVDEPAGMRRA